jgi:aspartate/methionine/tyrosine aminotransferase
MPSPDASFAPPPDTLAPVVADPPAFTLSTLTPPASEQTYVDDPFAEARAEVARLREEACEQARPKLSAGVAPIRVMARMVADLEARCRVLEIPAAVMQDEIVNRTIGDVDVRKISAQLDGPEFATLADDMGLALPKEKLGDYMATGKTYRWLRDQMMRFERELLRRGIDLRVYELAAVGNVLLREMLEGHMRRLWGYAVPAAQIFISLGSLDGLNKFWQGYASHARATGIGQVAAAFPAPGFNVPEWQAKSFGMRIHRLYTQPEDQFKVTPAMLRQALDEATDLRVLYLTVSSNPTAFAYTPRELQALFEVVRRADRDLLIAADLAYVGTGEPAAERARMKAFNTPGVLERSVLFNSFSKTHTLTGDRFGYVAFGSPAVAERVAAGWANSVATLPADWQLRYMATVQHFADHPELEQRIRALYRLRRMRLVKQLRHIQRTRGIFAEVNLDDGGTVYNWSRLAPGEDVFSLFSKTGIAGVPGGAFGYSDDYVRLSVGCIPVPDVDE